MCRNQSLLRNFYGVLCFFFSRGKWREKSESKRIGAKVFALCGLQPVKGGHNLRTAFQRETFMLRCVLRDANLPRQICFARWKIVIAEWRWKLGERFKSWNIRADEEVKWCMNLNLAIDRMCVAYQVVKVNWNWNFLFPPFDEEKLLNPNISTRFKPFKEKSWTRKKRAEMMSSIS